MQERKPGSSINFKYKYRINALFYQKNPAWIRKVEGCIFFCIDALFRKNYNKIIRDNEFVYPYRLLKYMLRR